VSRGKPIVRTVTQTDAKGRFQMYPYPGTTLVVTASVPAGPYLTLQKTLDWPKGAAKQELKLALTPAERVRGKVVEEADGKPVAGARLDFWSKGLKVPENVLYQKQARTGDDGSFEVLLPHGRWHVLANAPSPDHLCQKIAVADLTDTPSPNIDDQ